MEQVQYVVIDDTDGFDDVSNPLDTFEEAAFLAQRRARWYHTRATVLALRPVATTTGDVIESLDPSVPRLDPLDVAKPLVDPELWQMVNGVWCPMEDGEPRYTVPLDELRDLVQAIPQGFWPPAYLLPFVDPDGDVYDLSVVGTLGRYDEDGTLCQDQCVCGTDVLGLAGALRQRGLL